MQFVESTETVKLNIVKNNMRNTFRFKNLNSMFCQKLKPGALVTEGIANDIGYRRSQDLGKTW